MGVFLIHLPAIYDTSKFVSALTAQHPCVEHVIYMIALCCLAAVGVLGKASNNSIAWRPALDKACSTEGGE